MKKIIAISFTLLFAINLSIACDCLMQDLESAVRDVKTIVKVRITEILDTEQERKESLFPSYQRIDGKPQTGYRAKLEILNSFKGKFKEGEIIELSSTFSNCEYIYQIEEEFVLFLRNEGTNNYLKTCSYSEKISDTNKSRNQIKRILKELKK